MYQISYKVPSTVPVCQIARLCDVTGESVRQWCRNKWLKAHKDEGHQEWIITFEDLVEHFESTPKHYEKLLCSKLDRIRDYKLRKSIVDAIVEIRRKNL